MEASPTKELAGLLAWMAGQPFEELSAGSPSLLSLVEDCIVAAHRLLWEARGLEWTRHTAYHWLHYEDPLPVERLADGLRRLLEAGASFDPKCAALALDSARRMGYRPA